MSSILVTGAGGQIGTELVDALCERVDPSDVVQLDVQPSARSNGHASAASFVTADVRNREALATVIATHEVEVVYHLASLLSATGEAQPDRAWDVNMTGLKNVLDLARAYDLRVFWPSSIAVFGPSTPAVNTPQNTILDPATVYGVTKRSGELLCQYYHRRYDLDIRSLRLPGIISHKTAPGGGTTDYTVEMYRNAARGRPYTCFLSPDTRLPMMYMPDAVRAIRVLMEADGASLSVRDSYNVAGFSLSPRELAASLRRHVPDFTCTYAPDDRQRIADTWPASVDDTWARTDWGWAPEYNLTATTADMLDHLDGRERERGRTEGRGRREREREEEGREKSGSA